MHDVIIIGGGPAGSTAATLLAKKGVNTLVLEKEVFPRFHIGESLLPCDLPIFERLGITLDGGPFLYKAGAEFFDERTGDHAEYLFKDGLPGTPPHAYQVERSKFDHVLLNRAKEEGATVHEGERVSAVEHAEDHVVVRTDRGTYEARYLVDATGQDAFMARQKRTMVPLRDFGIAAVFCHFDGLSDEVANELYVEGKGNIRVLILEDGWMWLIPLHGRRLSCGLVTRRKGTIGPELLDSVIEASPMIKRLGIGATRTPTRMIGNFSYRNQTPRGERWVSIGDAALFLDPVFSSGVSLAMLAAERLVETLVPALEEKREADPSLMLDLSKSMEPAYISFASLVGCFYHTRIVQNLFFAKDPDPGIRAGFISILAGDAWRDDNPFQRQLLSSSRRRFDPFSATPSGDTIEW